MWKRKIVAKIKQKMLRFLEAQRCWKASREWDKYLFCVLQKGHAGYHTYAEDYHISGGGSCYQFSSGCVDME